MSDDTKQINELAALSKAPFDEVVRKFETLMGQNNRVFLLGAGCSKCAKLPLMDELTDKVMDSGSLGDTAKRVLGYLKEQYDGGHGTTIEDYMSDIVDIMAIAARRRDCGAKDAKVDFRGKKLDADELGDVLNEIKNVMVDSFEAKVDIQTHREFVRAVYSLRTGKTNSSDRVDYLLLNYDTLVEDALALERLSYVDGFAGGAVGWWDANTYKLAKSGSRVFKLHGSIDWRLFEGDVLPRRMRDGGVLRSIEDEIKERVMIWPTATKYRETQRDPYAQLLEAMRLSLNPKEAQEVILTICGYRFADTHINAEIDRALHESAKRLNVLIFTEEEKPTGWVERWFKNKEVNQQVRIHAKRGFFHGDKVYPASEDLTWWKFENIVRLLRGER